MTINLGSVPNKSLVPVQDFAAAAAGNANSTQAGSNVANTHASVIDQLTSGSSQADTSTFQPNLTPPNLTAASLSESFYVSVRGILSDPQVIQDQSKFERAVDNLLLQHGLTQSGENALRQLAEQGFRPDFDISKLTNSQVLLLVTLLTALKDLAVADSNLSAQLSEISFKSATLTAASLVREGVDTLGGAVGQSVLQLAVTGVGAKMSYTGLAQERKALNLNGGPIKDLNIEADAIRKTLSGNSAPKLDVPDNGGLNNLKTNRLPSDADGISLPGAPRSGNPTPASDDIALESNNSTLSQEQRAVLSERLKEIETKIQGHQMALEENKLIARKSQIAGDAVRNTAPVVGTIAGASGQYSATLERSEQQFTQASQQVANASSQQAEDAKGKSRALILELLRQLDAVSQSKNATIGTVAGNIRV